MPILPLTRGSWLSLAGVLLAPAILLRTPLQDDPDPLPEPAPAVALRPPGLTGLEDFACTECHASIVDEWASTSHAIAWEDEVYQAALAERKNPRLCTSCHIPGPLLVTGEIERPRAREADLHHGVDCAACHLGPDDTWLGPHGAPTDAHATAASEHFTTPGSNALCARCHATNIGPVIGIAKDFEAAGLAERGLSCVGCHLAPLPRASEDEPLRRSHALQTPRDPAFLARAFHVRRSAAGVVVENRAGHRVPGLIGREIRLRAQALDASGAVVAESERTLDARAHLVVDGSFELEVAGGRIRVLGDHLDPREPDRWVRFLEEDLE